MTERDCLSSLELLELQTTSPSSAVREHLEQCKRCATLRALLPEDSQARFDVLADALGNAQLSGLAVTTDEQSATADGDRPAELATGQVWLAPVSAHWNEVVVVLGRKPGASEMVLVTPVATNVDMAAEGDIVVDEGPLGYRHLVCVWNTGAVNAGQLETYRGRLARDVREAMVATYRALTTEGTLAAPSDIPPIVGDRDPRLAWRAAFQDRIRALYRDVDRQLDEEAEVEAAPAVAAQGVTKKTKGATRTRTATTTFASYLAGVVDDQSWDEVSLAERAEITRSELQGFMNDQFDLSFRSDTDAVVRLLKVVADDPEEIARGPLYSSLLLSEGGMTRAQGETDRIAASSFAGVSDEKRDEDIYRDQIEVDDSDEGRRQAAELYLADVIAAL